MHAVRSGCLSECIQYNTCIAQSTVRFVIYGIAMVYLRCDVGGRGGRLLSKATFLRDIVRGFIDVGVTGIRPVSFYVYSVVPPVDLYLHSNAHAQWN